MTKELDCEIWKTVDSFENYLISNYGRVKNINHRWKKMNNKILKLKHAGYKNQYHSIILYKNSHKKQFLIHRLVASNFINLPDNFQDLEVGHLDNNPKNNFYKNLIWCTPKENNQMKILHGTSGKGEKNAMSKLNENDIFNIFKEYSNGISCPELFKKYKISTTQLNKILKRKAWNNVEISFDVLKKVNEYKIYHVKKTWGWNKNKSNNK